MIIIKIKKKKKKSIQAQILLLPAKAAYSITCFPVFQTIKGFQEWFFFCALQKTLRCDSLSAIELFSSEFLCFMEADSSTQRELSHQ